MHDLVIRGGTIVDGSGNPRFTGDIAVDGGRITAVGAVTAPGREEIAAKGLIVTPGFVDIHTHYDGQATWDSEMAPSSWHGVTTVVMGNCGVGFAPAKPEKHQWLIGLMEGVEDIPGTALAEGMTWDWETFPEYLTALEKRQRTIDVATHVPHGAVRAYVMGERGARNEKPTADDIAKMAEIVADGVKAGALGFSTSRTILHKSIDGELVPGTTAEKDELIAIGRAMGKVGHGVFEMASDLKREWDEFGWMAEMSRETGLPVTFAMLQSIAKELPWDEQWQHLRDPAFKAKLLAEDNVWPETDVLPLLMAVAMGWQLQFEMTEGFNYEPTQAETIFAMARAAGKDPAEYAYDLLSRDEGKGFIYFPILNYADGNLDFVKGLLHRDDVVISLSDGGAHCGTICDAASPTYLLQHWVRDRTRGTVTLENAIRRQCHDTAKLYGLNDRGIIAPGYLADFNIIDLDRLQLGKPWLAFDLPAGGKRLLQKADGYVATIKNGDVTFRNGLMTGALPCGLIRGPQASPATAALAAE